MTTKDEALKLALEALEYIDLCDNDRDFLHPHECFQLDNAIIALHKAIAQALNDASHLAAPVQEPVAIHCKAKRENNGTCPNHNLQCGWPKCNEPPAAHVQEPVAWMHWLNGPCRLFMSKDDAMLELDRLNREYPADSHARKMRPLVFDDTTPPAARRQWVGLTPREIYNLWEDSGVPFVDWDSFASITRAIEAKLRNKNGWRQQHVTDGNPCWCEPETRYTDPETGASVIVHKDPQ